MPTEIASLYATLSLRDTMTSALSSARSGLSGLATDLQRTGTSISSFGATMSMAMQPLIDFGQAGIQVASDFQSSMAEIQARTGATDDEIERLRQTTIQLGADTLFTAQQANDAFLQLLATGMSMEDAYAAIEPIMEGAMAAGGDLEATTIAVTATLAGFGLEADEAGRVVNVMAQAAGASAASMGDMGDALADVSGVASGFGLTFEETAASLAIFSNANIVGVEAGTSLRSMLRTMYSGTTPVTEALNDLGVSLYDAAGNARPFNEVLVEIDTALEGMSEEDQIRIVNDLAGSFGLAGFQALMAADGLDDMTAAMANSTDVSTMADTMMNTFAGTMDSLGGSVEALQINAFTPFMENVLTPLAAQAIEIVNTISDWAATNPELTATIITITAAAAAFFAAMIPLGMIISAVGAGLAVLASPILLVAAGVAALGFAFATNFGGIRDIAQPVLDAIGNVINTVVIPAFNGLVAAAVDLWTDIQPGLQALQAWFTESGMPLITQVINDIFIPAATLIGEVVGGIWAVVEPALTSLFNWFMTDGLPAISDFLSNTVIPLISGFIDILATIWDVVSVGLLALHEWWQNTFVAQWLSSITGEQGIQTVIEGFGTVLSAIWNLVRPPLESLYNWFSTNFPGIVTDFIQPLINAIGGIVSAVGDAIEAIGSLDETWAGVQQNANIISEGVASGQYSAGDVIGAGANAIWSELTGGHAYGGAVAAGVPTTVGELGRETFIPETNGTIVPNGEMGSSIQVVFNGGQAPRDEAEATNAAFMLVNSLRARGVKV
jgi:TP901 family phage tail tape measure protein